MGVRCTWVKRLTDLHILGCELHKNAFGGRRWGSYSAPPNPLAVIWGGGEWKGMEGKERLGNMEDEEVTQVKDVNG